MRSGRAVELWDLATPLQPTRLVATSSSSFLGLSSSAAFVSLTVRQGLLYGTTLFGATSSGNRSLLIVWRPRIALDQKVTFVNPFDNNSELTFTNAPIPLRARSSSGRPVTFRVASGPGQVTGDRLRLTGAGDVLVVAEQLGDDQWFTAAVTHKITVKPNTFLKWMTPATPVVALNSPQLEHAQSTGGIAATLRVGFGPARIEEGRLVVTNVGAVQLIAELNTPEWVAAPRTRWFNPAEVSFQSLGGHTNGPATAAVGVTVAGATAFVAEGTNGVRLVRLTEPDRPQSFGRLPTIGSAGMVAVDGPTAYVTTGVAGVEIFAWSDAGTAERLAILDTPGNASAVRLTGSRLYVADGGAGWSVYDVADPRNPRRLGGVDTPGLVQDLQVVGPRLFVADGSRGLSVYSVTDPTAPERVGHFDVTIKDADGLSAEGQAMRVQVVGSTAYLLDWPVGVRILDVTDPANPQERGRISNPRRINGMTVSGTKVALAVGADGIETWDVSDPATPVKAGTFDTAGSARAVASTGGRWMVADREGGLLVLADEPAGLRFAGGCGAAEFARRIQVEGGFAYVANGLAGLKIFDVRNPALPRPVGELDTPGNTVSLHVVGDRAYLADELGGMRIVDVSAPSRPVALGSYRTTAPIRSVEVRTGVAWVAADGAGVETLDIRIPTNVTRLGRFQTVGAAGDVAVADDYAFASDSSSGLVKLSASDPANLVVSARYFVKSEEVELCGPQVATFRAGQSDPVSMHNRININSSDYGIVTIEGRRALQFYGGEFYSGAAGGFALWENGEAFGAGGYNEMFNYFALGVSNVIHGLAVQDTNVFLVLGERGLRVVSVNRATQRAVQTISSPTNLVYSAGRLSLPAQASSGLPLAMEVLSGPGSVEGGQLRLTGAGVLRLRLIQAGSELFKPVTNVVNVTVVPNQSIQLLSPTNTALEPGVAHPIVATASSGLPVTARVLSGPAEVRDGALWVTNIGRVVWTVEQAGNGMFVPASLTNRVNTMLGRFEQVGSVYFGDYVRALKVVGGHAFVARDRLGVAVLDVSNPVQPVYRGSVAAGRQAAALDSRGKVLFVTGEAGDLAALDISTPANPVTLGLLALPGAPQSVRVLGNYLLVPAGAEGLLVIEATDPSKMRLVTRFKLGGFAESVALSGHLAYVATGMGGLTVLDIRNPESPEELGRLPVAATDYCWNVEVAENTAYVSTHATGLLVVDVKNPSAPDLLSRWESGAVWAVRVRDRRAHIASSNSLTTYGVANVSAPTLEAQPVLLTGSPLDVEIAGDYAYVAGGFGVSVVRIRSFVDQQITHTLPTSVPYSTKPIPLVARSSSGLPVRWQWVTGPGRIVNDELQVSGVGEVILELTQAGAGWLEPVILRTSVYVYPAAQTLAHEPLPELISRFRPTTFSVTSSVGLPVAVSVSGPATVSSNRVTVTGEGWVSVWASQDGNGLYQSTSLSKGFSVRYDPAEVGWNLAALDLRFSPGTNAAGAVMAIHEPDRTNSAAGPEAELAHLTSANVRLVAGEPSSWRGAYFMGSSAGRLEFSSPELRRQLEARTNVAVSLQAERVSAPGTTPVDPQAEVVLTRTVGAAAGEYQVRVDNQTYSGTWTTAELTGFGGFDRVARRMTLSLQTTAPTDPAGAWTADTTFIPGPGASSLEFPAIDLASSGAAEAALRLGAVVLVWDSVRREFAGEVGMSHNGEPSPVGYFHLSLFAPQDEDSDGIPDVVDADFTPRLDWERLARNGISGFEIYGASGELFVLERSTDLKTWNEIRWLRTTGASTPTTHSAPGVEVNAPQFWRLRRPE